MTWVSGIVLYILIWWVALFAVLPIGTRPVREPDGTSGWRGTPERPRIGFRIGLTTLVSCVIWAVAYGIVQSDWISFRDGFLAMPQR